MTESRPDLTRIVLAVLFIGGLMLASFWILRPFLGALIWATMIVVPTWPLLLGLQRRAGGRRWIAATVMTVLLLMLLVVPVSATVGTLVSHADDIAGWVRGLQDFHLPAPPAWLAGIPFFGDRIVSAWGNLASGGMQAIMAMVTPYAGAVARWVVAQAGGVGALMLQFVLTVIAAAVLYARGEAAAAWMLRFGARLGGESGERAIRLSGQAIKGVALGVVVTAIVQSLIGCVGLLVAGVPFAAALTLLMFVAAVAQVGAAIVMFAAVAWLYWTDQTGWGTFLLVVSIFVATLDNVLRPILIKKGADLPLLLIFVGVIGGLVAFGLIGIFVGPVVLAVAHTLTNAWIDRGRV